MIDSWIFSYSLFCSLQFWFVLLAGVLLQNAIIMVETYQLQDVHARAQRVADEELETRKEVNVRYKRQKIYDLREELGCPSYTPKLSSSNSCVKAWFYWLQYDITEAICEIQSFKCFHRIRPETGHMRCSPVTNVTEITLPRKGRIRVKYIANCRCA